MAINKKLIHFKTFENFNSKKLSANIENTQYTLGVDGAVTNGEPDVKYQSICWIKDVQKIWTHGTIYNCADLISGTNIKTINGTSILGSGNIVIESEENIPYLTIEVLEDECTIGFSRNTIQYSTDLYTWNDLVVGNTVSANAGDKVYFKANLTPASYNGIGTFTVSKKFNLSGNCNSMLFGDDAATNLDLTGYDFAFYELFCNCTTLQSVSSTFLPATTLDNYCYRDMFSECTALTTAPELPATTLVGYCYAFMFEDCTNLNYIKMMATDISASNCLHFWVNGVSSTGTFVKNSAATWTNTGISGIPEGWAIEYPLDISGGTTDQILVKKSDITHDTEWTSVKTINGISILGGGDVVILTDANIQAVDTSETVDDVEINTYVKYVAQTLTEEQKSQVRINIGAVASNEIDLSNYYTKSETDVIIGDINSILESIINS